MESRYPTLIEWSANDKAFVAVVPDLPGCMTHGRTREEAARNAEEAIQGWLEAAREAGRPIPRPSRRLVSA